MGTIVETLAERVYAHGHAIGISEARDIGLPVTPAPEELDALMWDLLGEYERDLRLLEPLDPWAAAAASLSGKHEEEWISAVVETTSGAHEHAGTLTANAQRQMPPTLTVNVNVPVSLPPGLDLNQLTPEAQQVLQGVIQAAQQAALAEAQRAAQQSLQDQAPIVNVDGRLLGAAWRKVDD